MICAAWTPQIAEAQVDFFWSDPNGGNFNDPGNWQSLFPGALPDVFVRTVFDLPQTYKVPFPRNELTKSNSVCDGNVRFDLRDNVYRHGNLFVGKRSGDIAELTIIDGTIDSGPTQIGDATFLEGNVEIVLLDDFESAPGDTFVVLDALGLISDNFENVLTGGRLLTEGGSGSFRIDYGVGSPFDASPMVLSYYAIYTLTSGMDRDFDVDGTDFTILQRSNPALITAWQAQYGAPSALISGDRAAAAYNRVAHDPSTRAQSVPEPAVWAFLLHAAAALLFLPQSRGTRTDPLSRRVPSGTTTGETGPTAVPASPWRCTHRRGGESHL
jgi:hypothetical protein